MDIICPWLSRPLTEMQYEMCTKNLVKFVPAVFETRKRTEKQTNKQMADIHTC